MAKPLASRAIVPRKLDELALDPENARKHSERDVDAIALSLEKFGQQSPIVVDSDDIIVKGNGTFMAAMLLGWTEIDTIKTTLSGEALRAYAIADNRTAELSAWDTDRLLEQLESFESEALKAATGFDEAAILSICGSIPDASSLLAPPPEAEPPSDFPEVDESIATEHVCPKCSYRWSGKANQ